MKQTLYLREDVAQVWRDKDVFQLLEQIPGEIFRDKEGRRTLRFSLLEKTFFLKYHSGVGWPEILKNLFQCRLPILSAKNEWQAVQFLQRHHLDTMTLVAYGERGWNPARRHSFVVTEDLVQTMSLEHLGQQWKKTPPTFTTKKQLIEKLAHIAGTMHRNGMNHRDFYLCHFLLDEGFAQSNIYRADMPIYLIDLHRAQMRKKVPLRWQVKDLGSLYFSAYDVPMTQRDVLRFIRSYSGLPLRTALSKYADLWQKVQYRADKLYRE